MTFDEAQPIVADIMANTSIEEQLRLLRFFNSPKIETIEAALLKRKSFGDGPAEKPRQAPRTMVVAVGAMLGLDL
jgi:hypothetical protein